MKLRELLAYDSIVIQCHDGPDADAFACGYAVHSYLTDHGKKVNFIYGGRNGYLKPNLQYMKDLLHIPVEHVEELPDEPDYSHYR